MSKYDVFPITPDYPLERQPLGGALRHTADSGRIFQRQKRATAGLFSVDLRGRATPEIIQVRDFHARMQKDYFLLRHDLWQVGSWNLLGPDAEEEHSVALTTLFYDYRFETAVIEHRLELLGLEPGDKISIAADVRTSVGAGEAMAFEISWIDAALQQISTDSTPSEAGASYVEKKLENITIPSGAVYFHASGHRTGGVSETGFIRKARMNRGATVLEFGPPFAAPPFVPRIFPVTFASEPPDRLAFNEDYESGLSLLEAPGAALPFSLYPKFSDYQNGGSFLEEGAGVAGSGTWTDNVNSNAHGAGVGEKVNTNLNTSDFFYWIYSGYGFRLYARKGPDLGIFELFLDGVSQGTIDLYVGSAAAAAALFTKLDLPLGLHVVKLKATNSKNASSSAKDIVADAIEVIA